MDSCNSANCVFRLPRDGAGAVVEHGKRPDIGWFRTLLFRYGVVRSNMGWFVRKHSDMGWSVFVRVWGGPPDECSEMGWSVRGFGYGVVPLADVRIRGGLPLVAYGVVRA